MPSDTMTPREAALRCAEICEERMEYLRKVGLVQGSHGHGYTISEIRDFAATLPDEGEVEMAENPCTCVPDGDDGTVAHLCRWHKEQFGKAYRMQNMAGTLTVENVLKLPQDKLRLFVAHGIQESTARKEAEGEVERLRAERDCYRAVLRGMEFQKIDELPTRGLLFCRTIGEQAKQECLVLKTLADAQKERATRAEAKLAECEAKYTALQLSIEKAKREQLARAQSALKEAK